MLDRLLDVSIRSLVLVLIAAAALTIPRVRRNAALQHTIGTTVVCAMLGLFLLGPALPRLPLRILRDAPVPIQATRLVRIAHPLIIDGGWPAVPVLPQPTPRSAIDWSRIAGYVYTFIAVSFLVRYAIGMLLVHRLISKSTALAEFRESESIAVPLTVGWLRPEILLPLEWREWDQAKLNAVLEHEGAHARRRDGLAAGLAGVNRCVFWFHPIAWWLERRLALLAELACDESCIAATGDRERYAQLLLEMAQVVDGSRGRLRHHALTMAASSHIRQRIDSILEDGRTFSRGLSRTGRAALALCTIPMVLAAGAITLDQPLPRLPLSLPPVSPVSPPPPPPPPPPPRLLAQVRSTPATPGQAVRLKFEVASIRPAAPTIGIPTPVGGAQGNAPLPPPPPPLGGSGCTPRFTMDAGRIDRGCVSLKELLFLDAFAVPASRLQGPDWMDVQRFDISAKLPEGATADQLPEMFQALLEERFGLAFHRESKERTVRCAGRIERRAEAETRCPGVGPSRPGSLLRRRP